MLSGLIRVLTAPLPTYGWGIAWRGKLMSALLKRCGKNLKLALPAVHIYNPKRLSLGDNVYIGYNSYIGDGDITFDDEVVLGPFCSVTRWEPSVPRWQCCSVAVSTSQSHW